MTGTPNHTTCGGPWTGFRFVCAVRAMGMVCALYAGFVLIAGCSSEPTIGNDPIPERFYRALDDLKVKEGTGPFTRPVQDDWSARDPVVIRLGLHDCLDLARANNFTLLIQELNSALAQANAVKAGANTDIILRSGVSVDREETQIDSRFAGDTRDTNETTRQNGDVRAIAPFNTGTEIQIDHSVQRVTTNSPFNTFEWSSSLTLTVRQNLLDGFGFTANRADLDVAEGEVQAVYYDNVAKDISVSYGVAEAYWNLVLAYEDLRVLERQRNVDRLRVEREQRREAEGLATPLDVLRAESTLATRDREIISAEYAVREQSDKVLKAVDPDALHGYHRVAGFRLDVTPKDSLTGDIPDITIPPMAGEVQLALAQRPELKAAVRRIENAGLRVRQREQALLPILDVELTGELNGRGDDYSRALDAIGETRSRVVTGGLTFEVPVSNSADRAAHEIAKVNQEQTILEARELEVDIILEVVDAVRGIDSGQKGVNAAKKARDLSQREFDAEVVRRDNGLGTSFEVELAESDFISAERDLIRARVVLELARLDLARATGGTTPEQ